MGIMICFFNPYPEKSIKTGILSLFGVSNFYLLRQSTDYFAPSTELNVFTHTWSLGVEEQFYFVFPIMAWFTGFSRRIAKGSRHLTWTTAGLSLASLIAFIYIYKTNQPVAYFSMPTRLWELCAGCLAFLSLDYSNKFSRAIGKIPPLITIGLLLLCMLVSTQFAVQATIAIVTLTSILLKSFRKGDIAYNLFTQPGIAYLGRISYSLYLWHWGVLCLSRWTIGIYWWSFPFQMALILFLSITSYRYVETPLRRMDWADAWWKSIGYGITASAITATFLFILSKIPGQPLYIGRKPSMIAMGVSSLVDTYSLKDSSWKGDTCILNDNDQVGKRITTSDCTLGSFSSANHRIVVIGNSFSVAFVQAFDDLVISDNYSVTITSSWGASPVQEIPNKSPWNKANDYYWRSVVPSLIKPLKSGDWVFLINDMASFSPKQINSESSEDLKKLDIGLRALSDKLSPKGIRLAVLHGNPFAREANCEPVIAAKQWFSPFGGPCIMPSRSESLRRRENLNKVLISLENEGKIRIIDLFDVFCPEDKCSYNAKNGQILYRDEFSHPSVEGVRLSSAIIRKILTSSGR